MVKELKLTIELIPQSAWNNNLRSYLTASQWNKVRKKCYSVANYRCEICDGVGPKHPVECHERWEFEEGKVKLVGLIALCPACHEVKHIGRAQVVGRGNAALNHFMKINKATKQQAMAYISDCFMLWRKRSKQQWELDVTYLEEYMGESLKSRR